MGTVEVQGELDGSYVAIALDSFAGNASVVFSGDQVDSNASGPAAEAALAAIPTSLPPSPWVTNADPGAEELEEKCSVRQDGKCWCQCITNDYVDHVVCSAIKFAAERNGEDVDIGYQYTDKDGSKCDQ